MRCVTATHAAPDGHAAERSARYIELTRKTVPMNRVGTSANPIAASPGCKCSWPASESEFGLATHASFATVAARVTLKNTTDIALFHSVLGVRPGIVGAASRLEADKFAQTLSYPTLMGLRRRGSSPSGERVGNVIVGVGTRRRTPVGTGSGSEGGHGDLFTGFRAGGITVRSLIE